MKSWYGMAGSAISGLPATHCHLQFVAMAMNMKRALVLLRGGVSRPTGDVCRQAKERRENDRLRALKTA